MITEWKELTRLTGGDAIIIQKVKLSGKEISIEGEFELPPLARLTMEDQVFVAMFVRSHGSIKEMEQIDSVQPKSEVLAQLERGEITVDEAIRKLK
jgi:hypothetical protein